MVSILSQLGAVDPRAARSQFVDPNSAAQPAPKAGFLSRLMGGLNKMSDELLTPTSGLGKLGAYVGAASGSDLGRASMAAMHDQRIAEQDAAERDIKQAQLQEMLRKAAMPRIETLPGGIVGIVDQNSGAFTPTFTAPTDAERYASARGFDQGSQDWNTALQDYVLRGSGPTAHEFDVGLESVRQDNRENLEGQRQRNRLTLKGQPTFAQTHPRAARFVIGGVPRVGSGSGSGSGGGGVVAVRTPAEAQRLPSGTKFRTPDGQVRVRK